jgi:predicted ATPase/transcriptional regulator with XRE-family HTH domain
MSDPSTFRIWLKRRRTERGLTQEDLGEFVGYAAQTIRKIEGGQRRPSLQLALKLAQALELGPDEQAAWMNAARAVAEPDKAVPVSQPLRPPTPSPGLPTYLTPFVGRAQEQAELTTLLGRPDCRLLTVLGPGGVGKTRLAIETARAVPGFADGIAFVSLAPVAAPESVVPAIGDALGFTFVGSGDLFAQLLSYLRERHVLLILDNLEHLLDSAGVTLGTVDQLLQHASGVSVLATSRERLRLVGEWVMELRGLLVPQPHTPAQPTTAPALRLFVEHAERVDRAFRLTPENEATITAICRLVDGLPLGIELAAAWTRLLSLEEIANELTRGLDTAHLSPRTLPARHHSLHAVVDHSWQLLTHAEREALRRLSVFQGGFSREAAAQVAGANLPMLASLVDKSLLRRSVGGRYDLHEVIRQYADARLQEHADALAATRSKHAAYVLRFLIEREQRLKGVEQVRAMVEIGAEIDNVRAAWHWAAVHGPFDELERAGEVLQWFYEFRGWFGEGTALFAQAIEQLRSVGAVGAGEAWRRTLGRLLGNYGYLAARLGISTEADAALTESYALLADENDPVGLGRTLNYQAQVARWSGNYAEARRLLDRSLEMTNMTGDHPIRAMTLTAASNIAATVGEYGEAEQLFRAALANWRVVGNPHGLVWCITSCSPALLALGKYREAEQLLRESLVLSHTSDDRTSMAATLRYLGLAALQQGDVEASIYFFREALPLLQDTANWQSLQVRNDLGAALWQAGAKQESKCIYSEVLSTALQFQFHNEVLGAVIGLATHLSHEGNYAAALGLAARVLTDPASSDEARRSAMELRRAARAHLSVDEATRIEQQASALPLAAVLAELGLPGIHR